MSEPLSDSVLDQLFREARSFNGWSAKVRFTRSTNC